VQNVREQPKNVTVGLYFSKTNEEEKVYLQLKKDTNLVLKTLTCS
jgi:hypothetical protein